MSIWISKALLPAALLALLAGCSLPKGAPAPLELGSRFSGPPPARMGVAAGAVVVQGPKGFCIDRDASADQSGQSALIVLSACRGLGAGMFTPAPKHSAMLTAAVAAPSQVIEIADYEAELRAFFFSRQGHALLSRSGDPKTVSISETFADDGAWFIHLRDAAPFIWGQVQSEYWRAVLPLGGRMVTLSVLTMPDNPLSQAQGLELLRAFVDSVRGSTARAARPAAG